MRNYAAECLGTFVLVFGGCGAAVLAADHIGYAGVAAAFGLSLLVMVYTVGPISGCHLNPAVTLGLVIAKKFDPGRAPGYVAAQIVGGVLAAGVLLIVASGTGHFDPVTTGFATNGYGDRSPGHYGMLSCFVSEVVMTALLMLVILGSTDIKAPVGFAGIAIGLSLTVIHLVSIPVTNTSVNPARSIGPALFAGGAPIEQLWLFIVAPCLGAALAAYAYNSLRPIDPEAQITTKAAVQSLATEQGQRIDAAVATPARAARRVLSFGRQALARGRGPPYATRMRNVTYAIGDIHGRLDLMQDLLDCVEADAIRRGSAATIVFTGDYVDRGPDSRGVVARLIAGPRRPQDRFIPLRGNHDDLFVTAVTRGGGIPGWAWELYAHTVTSYGVTLDTLASHDAELRSHATYLAALPLVHDDGRYLFVHAGIRPGVPLTRQSHEDLTWIREGFLDHEGELPRRVVHGHTIMGDRPVTTRNRISIDTGAYRSGILTAAVLDGEAASGEPSFLQAIGEPDRAAIVREATIAATMTGGSVPPALQAVFDDVSAGRIDVAEMTERVARLTA